MERIINGDKCQYHHTAAAKGYISRKVEEKIVDYSGKFGTGYKVCKPRFDTNNFCYVEYWLMEEMYEGIDSV